MCYEMLNVKFYFYFYTDFIYLLSICFYVDGVVLVDADYIKDRKVFGHVLAAFRYGREDLDVLGLTFRKDLYLASEQIFPLKEKENQNGTKRPLTRLQERLIKKLGSNAYPFFFEVKLINMHDISSCHQVDDKHVNVKMHCSIVT